ncbi:MAG: hypothetical protein GXP55_01255 [Deltaproteobacteria bacterium]|nr:hypothetical protein [Deltaproteobacteria bacterium]
MKHHLCRLVFLILITGLMGCGGSSSPPDGSAADSGSPDSGNLDSGGPTDGGVGVVLTETQFPIDPNAIIVDKDHPNAGNDLSTPGRGGSDAPFASIQHALSELARRGRTLYVKPAATPYFEPYRMSGLDAGGITIKLEGTEESPFVISGYPGLSMPVIDQQRGASTYLVGYDYQATEDSDPATKGLNGFLIESGSKHVTIRGFEIRNTSGIGIITKDGTTLAITIEYNHIHNCYGVDNIAAVRLDWADGAIVRENILHDTYSSRLDSNPLTDEPYGLASGIHGYRPTRSQIYNNEIYNVKKGVFEKQSHPDLTPGHTIYWNRIHDVAGPAFELGLIGSSAAPNRDDKFYENIIERSGSIIAVITGESNAQPDGLLVRNNTAVDVTSFFAMTPVTNVEIYNNIVVGSVSGVMVGVDERAPWTSGITYIDNNCYYTGGVTKFITGWYGSEMREYDSLGSWQTAFSSGLSASTLSADPDLNSIDEDPAFVGAGDYHLQAGSPAAGAGRDGVDMGAYRTGTERIGPSWRLPSS